MTTLTTPAVARSRDELLGAIGSRDGRFATSSTNATSSTSSTSSASATDGRRGPVVFVPTMGALHEGHATLLRAARERAGDTGVVVLSIFVNPLQFGAGEDLDRYPRTFDSDLAMAAEEGVDVVFAPVVAEMYPDGVPLASTGSTNAGPASEAVTVVPGALADRLEGASRPGHFRGVLTVVAKLFGLVRPDVAIFGEKDYQQLALIRRMTADLCLGIEIVGAPTDREPDGLARSSRNRYLSAEERRTAAALSRALRTAQDHASEGPAAAEAAALAVLEEAAGVELDYLALTTTALDELPDHPAPGTEGRVLIAARVGTTRLIDNMPMQF